MSQSASEDAASSNSSTLKQVLSSEVDVAEPDTVSPILSPLQQTHISNLGPHQQQHHRRTSVAKRRLSEKVSFSPAASPELGPQQTSSSGGPTTRENQIYEELHGNLISQLTQWLHHEKQKRIDPHLGATAIVSKLLSSSALAHSAQDPGPDGSSTTDGHASDTDTALEKLERILRESDRKAHRLLGRPYADKHRFLPHRKSSTSSRRRRLSHTGASSDTEYVEGDVSVPSTDVVLDNSKTLGFTGGTASSELDLSRTISKSVKEGSWLQFKNEIIRLTHTLRIKGWRQVPLGSGSGVGVERLSGALTNAVYVVSPPSDITARAGKSKTESSADDPERRIPKRKPNKLLLRIYGPQVEHLIDRESELQILKRLARKNIGPRLLGTFGNGRFEEYLHATTLTPEDLRKPETYKQIAKRMRELHDGIELLDRERKSGPFVWQNWDKWVARCGEVITWVDEQILAGEGPISPTKSWKSKGLVCGVEWTKFRKAVEMYRKWLTQQYGGESSIRNKLVFAHNDTQYGNLLRIVPTGESPLLLPANEHKQLVVIDFEYANANPPGMEFANHFTEWCYNYHSQTQSYACNVSAYPSIKDQRAFLQAYVQHSHLHMTSSPELKPSLTRKSNSSISNFMLDSRGPSNQYDVEEKAREEAAAAEIDRLLKETRLWRVANSAQWVAWGIVQAKIPGMDEALEARRKTSGGRDTESAAEPKEPFKDSVTDVAASDNTMQQESAEHDTEVEIESEFDYLAYAQQRAFFFWGDLLELGLIKEDDLPENVLKETKRIPY